MMMKEVSRSSWYMLRRPGVERAMWRGSTIDQR